MDGRQAVGPSICISYSNLAFLSSYPIPTCIHYMARKVVFLFFYQAVISPLGAHFYPLIAMRTNHFPAQRPFSLSLWHLSTSCRCHLAGAVACEFCQDARCDVCLIIGHLVHREGGLRAKHARSDESYTMIACLDAGCASRQPQIQGLVLGLGSLGGETKKGHRIRSAPHVNVTPLSHFGFRSGGLVGNGSPHKSDGSIAFPPWQ